jgi:peptide-methionine (S)-S-oxide reductase
MNKKIVFGGGCFWCMEAIFQSVKGVQSVISGYSGGIIINPNYEQVCSGTTGHAEVVEVTFDPTLVTIEEILNIFWHLHDPTTLNRQGADTGTQYRSIVFFNNDEEKKTIESILQVVKKDWSKPILSEIVKLEKFYQAEDYHQNYFKNHPEQGYCNLVINPKIKELKEKYFDLLV